MFIPVFIYKNDINVYSVHEMQTVGFGFPLCRYLCALNNKSLPTLSQ